MTAHPYRYECPEGHTGASLNFGKERIYCRMCGESYDRKQINDKLESEVNVV